ncbi:MAG: hypothetical protein O2948_08470 [Proteobacteria bacterium]|nr:hypothetical protein [Pseudomonadota bacterium]
MKPRQLLVRILIALASFWLVGAGQIWAAEQTAEDADTGTNTSRDTNPWRWLDEPRDALSRNVTAWGRSLDAWLAGESINNLSNESFLSVRLNQQFSTRGDLHSRLRIGGSLDLPQTTERWKFIFESDSRELNSLQDNVLGEEPSGNSVGGFRYLQRASEKFQLSHSVGLRGRLPLDPYYRMRANFDQPLWGGWGLGVRQRIWHYDSEGWGYNTNLAFRKALDDSRILHIASDIQYQQERKQIEFGQSVVLHRLLSEHRSLSYEAGVYGTSKPNRRVNLYYAGVKYRRAIREDWLFFEVLPQLLMERENSWNPRPRLSINLEMLFFQF